MSGDNKVKLIYFNGRGRAELARLIMVQANVDYEDFRCKSEDWPEMKKTMPVGQLPALEYKGETIGQSMAIARFLARENGLYGKSSWESAKADMVVDCVVDLLNKAFPIVFQEKDEEKKKEKKLEFVKDYFKSWLVNVDKILEKNGGEFFVGKELTFADLAVADGLFTIDFFFGSDWKKESPKLVEFEERIFNLPRIKKWIETRPKTEF